MFKAILVEKNAKNYQTTLQDIEDTALPDGNVTVKIIYSTLNYKDALAITGRSPIVRRFPMIPGVDFVGMVEDSQSPDYQKGDMVILNGWGVGEKHWGDYHKKHALKANGWYRSQSTLHHFKQ